MNTTAVAAMRTLVLAAAWSLLFCLPARATEYATPSCPLPGGCFSTVPSPPIAGGETIVYVELFSGVGPSAQVASQSASVANNVVQVTATWVQGGTFDGAPRPSRVGFTIPALPAGSYTFELRLSLDPSRTGPPPPVTTDDGTVVPNASVFVTSPFIVYPDTFVAPQIGLWWNPDESGTGYSFDTDHGTLVATLYSYTREGAPIWYLASGTIDNNNSVTATLYKYANGQCISCAYIAPTGSGDDGTMTVHFTSSTSATMTLPGRAPFTIVPEDF